MQRKNWILTIIIIFTLTQYTFSNHVARAADTAYPSNSTISPEGPVKVQTLTIPVTGKSEPNPKVIWTQTDAGNWEASRNEGGDNYKANGVMVGTGKSDENLSMKDSRPAMTEVTDKITVNDYPPDEMTDITGKIYNQKYITDLGFDNVEFKRAMSYIDGTKKYKKGDIFAIITTFTGYDVRENYHELYSVDGKVTKKYRLEYYTPLLLEYTGHVIEKKEIEVAEDATLEIGATTQLSAKVRSKAYNEQEFSDNWVAVTTREQTEWKSSDESVATVDSNGKVTAVAAGNAEITAYWKNDPWYLKDSATITVGDAEPPPTAAICTVPEPGEKLIGKYMDPIATAVIKSDKRGNETFDVSKGIPTSESLYGNVFARNYLVQNTFTQYNGQCTYSITVKRTYKLKWADGEKHDTVTKSYNYKIVRPYHFWKIDNLEVYEIKQSTLLNYAFAESKIDISPNNYLSPSFTAKTTGTFYAAEDPGTQNGGTKNLTNSGKSRPSIPNETSEMKVKAENAVDDVEVENDYLKFNGDLIMDNTRVKVTGPTPEKIKEPVQIGQNVLYSPNNEIPNVKENRKNATSKGTIEYKLMKGNIKGGADQKFDISGINTVTIHTPVVDYAVMPDDNRPFDQRMKPDMSKTVLILDRPFKLNFDEKGQHLNIPGYGNRDYKKYTLLKRVKFPFPVFSEDSDKYYVENKWISIPVGQPSITFKMPTWVDEGSYHIVTESWAVNSQGKAGCQQNYNGDLANYCATESFNVDVVGRVFGFRVWDIGDLRYENIFRTAKGSNAHTKSAYYSGGRDENGQKTDIFGQNSWILPVRPNSYPNQAATVPHNGYAFLFDLKTIGNMWNKGEGVRINPTFYYVSKKGGNAVPVDLYYDSTGATNKLIKVGSSQDVRTFTRKIQLPDTMRNISKTELSKAADYEYNSILTEEQQKNMSWSNFSKKFLSREITVATGYAIEVLNYQTRTLIGATAIPKEVKPVNALRSVQHWYGEYNLPVAPYILSKGTDVLALSNKYGGKLDGHEKEFYRNGYIVVNFDIYTVKNSNQSDYILGYESPNANMWKIEGQVSSDKDYLGNQFKFKSGDIMMFESDYSARNDFQNNGK